MAEIDGISLSQSIRLIETPPYGEILPIVLTFLFHSDYTTYLKIFQITRSLIDIVPRDLYDLLYEKEPSPGQN